MRKGTGRWIDTNTEDACARTDDHGSGQSGGLKVFKVKKGGTPGEGGRTFFDRTLELERRRKTHRREKKLGGVTSERAGFYLL